MSGSKCIIQNKCILICYSDFEPFHVTSFCALIQKDVGFGGQRKKAFEVFIRNSDPAAAAALNCNAYCSVICSSEVAVIVVIIIISES
jgi:hypothetical protein